MRATLARLMVFILAVLATLSMAPAAQASPSIVVYWEGAHAPGLNTICPADTVTDFIVTLRVQKGERIVSYGHLKLRLKNGKDKYTDGQRLNRRTVEFHVFAGRRAKVDKANPMETYAYPVELTEGARPKIRIMRTCIGKTP